MLVFSFPFVILLPVLFLQLNSLQIFNIYENDDGAAYAAKARMAMTLDKIDLVEGGYPVDVKKYPHVAPTKGKEPSVDDADDATEAEPDTAAQVDDEQVMAEAGADTTPVLRGGVDFTISSDDDDSDADDEAPALNRRRIQRALDEAGPSNVGVVNVSDDSGDVNVRPSSAPADLECVSSPP